MIEDENKDFKSVQNLSFNHPLSKEEIEELKKVSLFLKDLRTIYFNEGIDFNSIEIIKNILEFYCSSDDKKIEKYIIRKNSSNEIKNILDMSYQNPDTWQVAYKSNDSSYKLVILPKYREMETFLNRVLMEAKKSEFSPIEQIMKVYDRLKLLEYDESASNDIANVALTKKATNMGYNIVFKEVLNKLGINAIVEKVGDETFQYVTLVYIEDNKYSLSGIYTFDPSSDSLAKDKYSTVGIRRIGYNFFLLTLKQLLSLKELEEISGVLSIFSHSDYKICEEKLDIYRLKHGNSSTLELKEAFDMDFENIYDEINKTYKVGVDKLLEIIKNVNKEAYYKGIENPYKLIENNYISREEELFIRPKDIEFDIDEDE